MQLLQDVYHSLADVLGKIIGKTPGEVVDSAFRLSLRKDRSIKPIPEGFRIDLGQFFDGDVSDPHALGKGLEQPISAELGEDLGRMKKFLVRQQTEDELFFPVQSVFLDQLRPQIREDMIVPDPTGAIDDTVFTKETGQDDLLEAL